MIKIRNINDAPLSVKNGTYGGLSGLKDGVVIDGEDWIIKYPKNASYLKRHDEMSYTSDTVSEFLGSHIYAILGYPVHETMLVERKGKIAVACKDFLDDNKNERLLEIRTIKNSANVYLSEILEREFNSTGSSHFVDLEELLLHINYNDILKDIPGIKERFWDMVVIDSWINNSDRNNGNWGIIRVPGKSDRLAPIFDNGGSFNGKTPDSRLKKIHDNNDVMMKSVLNGQTSFAINEQPILVRQLMLEPDKIAARVPSFDKADLEKALERNCHAIEMNMDRIEELIYSIPAEICSEIRKKFYLASLYLRFNEILIPARCKTLSNCDRDVSNRGAELVTDDIGGDRER